MSLAPRTARTASIRAAASLSRSGASRVRYATTSASSTSQLPRSAPQQIPQNAAPALLPPRLKPVSPSYYTTKPMFVDTLLEVNELIRKSKRALEHASVLNTNSPAPEALDKDRAGTWLKLEDATSILGVGVRATQYKQFVQRLRVLDRYAVLVNEHLVSPTSSQTPQYAALSKAIEQKLALFSRHGRDTVRIRRNYDVLDERGRAYSRGRHKNASARVWIIPTKTASTQPAADGEASTKAAATQSAAEEGSTPHLGEVIINNLPLSTYLTRATHREIVTWPLRLTGTLGAFNVFAIARGGGNSGQSRAVAHGLANAISRYFLANVEKGGDEARANEIKLILTKDGIIRRDPRVVERKKTGQLKARKAFTWVKR